jgi:MoxR-like ATPase
VSAPVATRALIDAAVAEIARVLIGKDQQLRQALCCLLAGGHLLIEDLPGMGKTTLSHALAQVLGLSYKRVQFTSDLLPADILGLSIYHREDNSFRFHPGTDLHAGAARRRDQPQYAAHPERAPRGDGRAPGESRG